MILAIVAILTTTLKRDITKMGSVSDFWRNDRSVKRMGNDHLCLVQCCMRCSRTALASHLGSVVQLQRVPSRNDGYLLLSVQCSRKLKSGRNFNPQMLKILQVINVNRIKFYKKNVRLFLVAYCRPPLFL